MRKRALLPVALVAAAALLGLTAAVALASKARAIHGADGTLYVVERGLNTATAFDAATGQVVGGPVPVGVRPIGITAPRRGPSGPLAHSSPSRPRCFSILFGF